MKCIAAALLLGLVGCSSADTTPHAGVLTLSLTAGGSSDGALVVIVSGGPITSVAAPAGYQIASNADGEGTHIMVLGSITAGPIATVSVPDVSQAAAYVATVMQVSDRGTFALLDPVGYRVVIGK